MLKFTSIFYCLYFINAVYAKEVYVIRLLDNISNPSNETCFDSKFQFDESKCSRTENPCIFENRFPSFNVTPITMEMREDFFKYKSSGRGFNLRSYVDDDALADFGPGLQSHHDVFSDKTIKINRRLFPVGSEATIYESKPGHNSPTTITILKQFKVSEDGLIKEVYPIEPIHKLLIKFPDITQKDGNLSVSVFNEMSFKDGDKKEFEYTLSEGIYSFKAVLRNGMQSSQLKFKYRITKDSKFANGASNKILNIKKEQFKPIHQSNQGQKTYHQIIWRTEPYPSEKKIPKLGMISVGDLTKSLYFKDISSVIYVEGGTEFKDNFMIENGLPIVKNDKLEIFLSLINQKPFHTLKISGTCYSTEKKAKRIELDIVSKPDEKSKKLGNLIVEITANGNNADLDFQKSPEAQFEEVSPNLMMGSCRGESQAEIIHAVTEVKGDFVNWGKGPWGNKGWIKASYKEFADGGGRYEFKGFNDVTFTKEADGLITVKGTDFSKAPEGFEPGDPTPEMKVNYKIKSEELWSKDGNFVPSIDCSYGC